MQKNDTKYHYENYTVRAVKQITNDVLMKYVKSKRIESFHGITDFWYFDIDSYNRDLNFSGHEIPKEAT